MAGFELSKKDFLKEPTGKPLIPQAETETPSPDLTSPLDMLDRILGNANSILDKLISLRAKGQAFGREEGQASFEPDGQGIVRIGKPKNPSTQTPLSQEAPPAQTYQSEMQIEDLKEYFETSQQVTEMIEKILNSIPENAKASKIMGLLTKFLGYFGDATIHEVKINYDQYKPLLEDELRKVLGNGVGSGSIPKKTSGNSGKKGNRKNKSA